MGVDYKKNVKQKLKKRSKILYNKYYFNNADILEYIIDCIDNEIEINEDKVDYIFDVSDEYLDKLKVLIKYYPKLLKKYGLVNNDVIDEIYVTYGETIEIMDIAKKEKQSKQNVRGVLTNSAALRAKKFNREIDITSEDVFLYKKCPILNIDLSYTNDKLCKNSATLDRINSTGGYTKDNIMVISSLANNMKSNATPEEMKAFAKYVMKNL